MKKLLIAFSLSTALYANDNQCCCEPKECIDCVGYTPPFYDIECNCGFFGSVDFLYWYARETDLAFALKTTTILQTEPNEPLFPAGNIQTAVLPIKFLYLDAEWDLGFRVGLGWNPDCDGWDVYANWTYYHNNASEKARVPFFETPAPDQPGEEGLYVVWINQSTFQFPFFHEVDAKWRLNFNQIDLEIGRRYWLSSCFNLRPYAAVRGAWTKTNFSVESFFDSPTGFNTTNTNFLGTANDAFISRYWGVGFLGGLQPAWSFCGCVSLFGNLDMALIWGEFDGEKRERYFRTENQGSVLGISLDQTNRYKSDYFKMQAILDLAIGLRWKQNWCCDQFCSTLDVGWEHHIWFEHNERYKYSDEITRNDRVIPPEEFVRFMRSYTSILSNLVFGGLVVRGRIDF